MTGSPLTAEIPRMTSNLRQLYRRHATVADRDTGLMWYPKAHRIVCDWAHTYDRSITNVACVIAAVSPQIDWPRNLIVADDILAGRSPSVGGCLPANVCKAERVRDERVSTLLDIFPHGPKVNHFARNLAGDFSVVTVDSHGLQAALDDVLSIRTLRWSAYTAVASAYIRAAAQLALQPADLQAIIWVTWKRLHPTAQKRQSRRVWSGDLGEY